MTRGRKKDLTIQPSRALENQRLYRTRKAQHVANLEEKLKRVELENARLKRELDVAYGGSPSYRERTNEATLNLFDQLYSISEALRFFHQTAFPESPVPPSTHAIAAAANAARGASGPHSTSPPPPLVMYSEGTPATFVGYSPPTFSSGSSSSSNERPRYHDHSLRYHATRSGGASSKQHNMEFSDEDELDSDDDDEYDSEDK